MTAAILCPGPSLARWPLETFARYDVRVGVNRAAFFAVCDWRAVTDWQQITENGHPPYPHKLFTTRTVVESLSRRGKPIKPDKLYEDLTPWLPGIGWTLYTMTAAIVLAAWLGAKSIDLYGNDQSNAPDFDGHRTDHDNRGDTRWTLEAGVFRQLTASLDGVTVRRITLDTTED